MGISVEKLGRCGIDLEYTVHGAQNLELAKDKDVIALIGTKSALSGDLVTEFVKSVAKLFPSSDLETVWNASLKSKSPGDNGSGSALTYAVDGQLRTLYQGVVPDPSKLSRHNACYAVSVVTSLTSAAAGSSKNGLVIYVANSNELYAAGCAAARAFPLYSRKTGSGCADAPRNLTLSLCALDGKDLTQIHGLVASTGESIREVACMGDWPCDIMSPQMFVVKAEQVRDELKTLGKEIGMKVFRMKELVDGEFGGIVGVGQGAAAAGADREAALIHLSYSFGDPDASNAKSWAMVGKGIVFDTGGLHCKSRLGMNGMKVDMLGAAAQLGAFKTAVEAGVISDGELHAVLCVAENSISAWSYRPDDVLTMHSGRTVEINNTDAEGRLVLGDGVSYAGKYIKPNYIITTATLTGAQGVATGKRHGAVMSTSEHLEVAAVKSGKRTGDCIFPVLYAPELLKREFSSKVADMLNSVKDRANAQVSCAGQFIVNHLPTDFLKEGGEFAHLDIAAPAAIDGRATGFGVALLVDMVGGSSCSDGLNGTA